MFIELTVFDDTESQAFIPEEKADPKTLVRADAIFGIQPAPKYPPSRDERRLRQRIPSSDEFTKIHLVGGITLVVHEEPKEIVHLIAKAMTKPALPTGLTMLEAWEQLVVKI